MSQNVQKLILKSPRFVPFGANLTQFGCQIWHPCQDALPSEGRAAQAQLSPPITAGYNYCQTGALCTNFTCVCHVRFWLEWAKLLPKWTSMGTVDSRLVVLEVFLCLSFTQCIAVIDSSHLIQSGTMWGQSGIPGETSVLSAISCRNSVKPQLSPTACLNCVHQAYRRQFSLHKQPSTK